MLRRGCRARTTACPRFSRPLGTGRRALSHPYVRATILATTDCPTKTSTVRSPENIRRRLKLTSRKNTHILDALDVFVFFAAIPNYYELMTVQPNRAYVLHSLDRSNISSNASFAQFSHARKSPGPVLFIHVSSPSLQTTCASTRT